MHSNWPQWKIGAAIGSLVAATVLAGLIGTATAYDENRPVHFFHKTTCGQYAEDRKLPKGLGINGTDRSYVAGWISAANFYVAGFGMNGNASDLDDAMLWLDNYCQAHAFSTMQEGLRELVKQLAAKPTPAR